MSDSAVPQHSMLATFVLPIARALRLRGVDPIPLFEECGIDPAGLARPDWRIPNVQGNALMHLAIQETDDEAFGLLAAQQLQPQVLHGLGLAWLASDTVLDGLRRLTRFGQVISTGANPALVEEGDRVHVVLADAPGADEVVPAAIDYSVGMISRMCNLTLGEFIAPLSIDMRRPAPGEPQRWEYELSCRVNFEAEVTRITWASADIQDPLVTGDSELARVNDEQSQAYLDSFLTHSTTRKVVNEIVNRLPDGPPSQEQIASDLSLSNRTLQRKLKEEGTSFMDLLQDTRLQLAQKYLKQPTRSVLDVAYMLGFSEPSTFSRAFKRWTGKAPVEYREEQQSD